MSKTIFSDGNASTGILGTIITANYLNSVNHHRHMGTDVDGDGALDFAVTTGSANAYLLSFTESLPAYVSGMPFYFKASFTNTGAATLNINSLGEKALKKNLSDDMLAGDIVAGHLYICMFDGTNIVIFNPSQQTVPIGSEMMWPGETPPSGWLEENGASLLRADYPELFAILGTGYGAADSTHFNLPDTRGKFIRIWSHGSGTDPDAASRTAPTTTGATISAGDHVGTNQTDDLKSHNHAVPIMSEYDYAGGSGYAHTRPYPPNSILTANTGGNETRPANTYRMMVIKAKN